MSLEEIKEELIRLTTHEHMNIEGVEYLAFLRKNQFSFDEIPYENYAISLFSLKEYTDTKDITKLKFRKISIKNRLVFDDVNGDNYFDIFMSTKVSGDNEDLLIKCFNEKRLIHMFMKVRK